MKTKIDWCDYSFNPIKGICKHNCFYCYAIAMYKRFKWDKKIRLDLSVFDKIKNIKKPSKIFVCSTHDILGDWIESSDIYQIFNKAKEYPQHKFIFLSKNPKRYYNFYNLSDNIWRGVTITKGKAKVFPLIDSGIRFASFEPLLGDIKMIGASFDWIILGAMSGPKANKYKPKIEWIKNILRQADERKIPVFMKDNLRSVWKGKLRKEFPNERLDRE
jgi:protein gp37